MKPGFHCRVYKNPPIVPILSQMNHVHAIAHYSFKVYFNVTLRFTPRSSERLLSFWFPNQILVACCFFSLRDTCPIHLTVRLITLKYVVRNTSHEAPHYIIFFNPTNIFLSKLLSNRLNLDCSLNARDHISRQKKTIVYANLYDSRQQMGRQKILDRMVQ
jgi:hypothetical protein